MKTEAKSNPEIKENQDHTYNIKNKVSEDILPNKLWDHNYSTKTNLGIS